jgi:hypothetical protein
MCVTWRIRTCDVTLSYLGRDACVFVTSFFLGFFLRCWNPNQPLRTWFVFVTWQIIMLDMTHSQVWHDSFVCVTWLIHHDTRADKWPAPMCAMSHTPFFFPANTTVKKNTFIQALKIITHSLFLSAKSADEWVVQLMNDSCLSIIKCFMALMHESCLWCMSHVFNKIVEAVANERVMSLMNASCLSQCVVYSCVHHDSHSLFLYSHPRTRFLSRTFASL